MLLPMMSLMFQFFGLPSLYAAVHSAPTASTFCEMTEVTYEGVSFSGWIAARNMGRFFRVSIVRVDQGQKEAVCSKTLPIADSAVFFRQCRDQLDNRAEVSSDIVLIDDRSCTVPLNLNEPENQIIEPYFSPPMS